MKMWVKREKPLIRKCIHILITALCAVVMFGCQGDLSKNNDFIVTTSNIDDPHLTGAAKILDEFDDGLTELIPYTGAGHSSAIDEIKKRVNPQLFDSNLSRRLTHAQVRIVTDPKIFSKKLEISVGLQSQNSSVDKEIQFDVPLIVLPNGHLGNQSVNMKKKENSGAALNDNSNNNSEPHFLVDATCRDEDCKSVEVILKQAEVLSSHQDSQTSSPKITSETGFLYSLEESQVRMASPKNLNNSPSPSRGIKKNPFLSPFFSHRPIKAIKETVEVINGPSYFNINVPNPESQSESEKDILVVSGELFRTTHTTPQLRRAQLNGEQLKGTLRGNTEDGDIAIALQLPNTKTQPTHPEPALAGSKTNSAEKNKQGTKQQDQDTGNDQAEQMIVFFEKPPSKATVKNNNDFSRPLTNRPSSEKQNFSLNNETPKNNNDIWSNSSSAVIPVHFNDPKLREAQRITRQLEVFKNNPHVRRFITYWTEENKYQRCGKGPTYNLRPKATNFFHKMKVLAPYTNIVFKELDTTPEILYVSALESQYAVTDGWVVEASYCGKGKDCSTAVGPYQITETAARYLRSERRPGINLITHPLTESRQVHPNDDRGIFLPATFAFASYAKDLMDWFPEHPELWPLGYLEGQGALAVSMKCSQEKDPIKRASCKKAGGGSRAFAQRNRYRSTTLDEIIKYKMAPCESLDYALMYLALKFVGSRPNQYGIQIDSNKIPKKLPRLYRPGQNAENFVKTMSKSN